MGLDQNDTIVRRRIRQKLDFVADNLASQLEPTDKELQAKIHFMMASTAFRWRGESTGVFINNPLSGRERS